MPYPYRMEHGYAAAGAHFEPPESSGQARWISPGLFPIVLRRTISMEENRYV
jgi:hypothetical protein